MYIKWIEIYGFKSFYEKTKIDFNKGIMAIVGPNGSGKSNITDAIKWVLGEQSIKNLRLSKMEEIIFAGSEKRKPLGFAEVSVCIDNSDKLLNIDFDEVVITRRAFRNGENEYFLNKSACRLKDIYEVLFDSGLGKDGFSIISQGKVDEIINARSIDRFKIFEEACGVTRYKFRKEETEKKLKNTNENIQRIEDLINEIELQKNDIEPEKQKAEIFIEYKNSYDNLFKQKLKYSYYNLSLELEQLLDEISKVENDLNDIYNKLQTYKEDISNRSNKLENIMLEKNDIENRYSELKEVINNLNSKIKIQTNELNIITQNNNILKNEIENLENEIKQKIEQKQKFNDDFELKNNIFLQLIKSVKEYESKFKTQMEYVSKLEDDCYNKEIELIEILNNIEKNQQKIQNHKKLLEQLIKRLSEIDKEIDSDYNELNNIDKEITNTNNKKQTLLDTLLQKKQQLNEIKQYIDELENSLNKINDEIKKASSNLIQKQEKYKLLNNMENSFEGYNKTIKDIYKRIKDLNVTFYGTVGSLISVKKEYLKCVEVSLGSSIQDLVVEKEEDAKKIIDLARNEKLGRVTIIPINAVEENQAKYNIKAKGFLGFADKFVQIDENFKKVITLLIGKILVFDNIDNAINFEKSNNYKYKCVTLSGEVINPGGIFSGGEKKFDSSILSRKIEIEELKSDIDNLKQFIENFENKKIEIEENKKSFILNLENLKLDIENINSDISKLENQYEMQLFKKAQINQKIKRLENEKRFMFSQKEELEKEINECQKILLNLNENSKKAESDILILKNQISENKNQLEMFQNKYNEEIEQKNNIEMDIKLLHEKIKNIEEVIESLSQNISNKKNEYIESNKKIDLINNQIVVLQDEYESFSIKFKEIRKQRDEINLLLTENEKVLKEKEKEVFEINKVKDQLESNLNRLKIKEVELNSQIDYIKEKYLEKTNESISKEAVTWNENYEQELIKIKEDIEKLGQVNLGTIDQYQKLTERINFLNDQIKDLSKTKDELLKLIDQLDKNMHNIFLANFEKLKLLFEETFAALFNGGYCNLKLVKENEQFGVEIEAKPPGKKTQTLSLLSGGEKALTAIALLFSFLIFKGSSLCILDEIDSSLDEVNVQRFARFIKDTYSQGQVIIVTHRKPTMEIADLMYGVTMEEQGISKILSIDMHNIK
ncbi:chromosome segregation protein SMC [Caldicellulosiruptoraceae bacterium PP1]